MKVPSRTSSGFGRITCPMCGSGELRLWDPELAGCDSRGGTVGRTIFRTLEQIVALPEVLGGHACECGHPEMRYLPDGVFHCPACGSKLPRG
jgi:hypothetical protein